MEGIFGVEASRLGLPVTSEWAVGGSSLPSHHAFNAFLFDLDSDCNTDCKCRFPISNGTLRRD